MGIGTVLCALVVLLLLYSGLYSSECRRLTTKYLEMQKNGRVPLFILGAFWPRLYDNTGNKYWLGEAMKPAFFASGNELIMFYTMSWRGIDSKI